MQHCIDTNRDTNIGNTFTNSHYNGICFPNLIVDVLSLRSPCLIPAAQSNPDNLKAMLSSIPESLKKGMGANGMNVESQVRRQRQEHGSLPVKEGVLTTV